MRKKNQEIKDKAVIENILLTAKICRIAMIDEGSPYLLPFNYGYSNNHIYIHSAPEGRKIDVLKKNNQVCFEIEGEVRVVPKENPCSWYTSYQSVVGTGFVYIIEDADGKRKGLDIIMQHHGKPGNHDYPSQQLEKMIILKLNITELNAKQSSNFLGPNN
jgi:hypothetical protein